MVRPNEKKLTYFFIMAFHQSQCKALDCPLYGLLRNHCNHVKESDALCFELSALNLFPSLRSLLAQCNMDPLGCYTGVPLASGAKWARY